MSPTVISIENLSKSYRLGVIGTGTFYGDLKRWWARQRGKPDPYSKVGEIDHGNRTGETLWALRDINCSIQQGDAVGIIGRNGAGKSTLLKILSRVTAPTSGEVKIKGRIASLLEVGTGFHPELTGRENIFLNGAIMGMSRQEIQRKFDEIVDFSGVEKFIDTPVKRYSSGMYVRLAFAVAAHLEPEILIIDEVLAVGDAEFQKKCLGKMNDVSKNDGRTVLFVSHNLAAVQQLCKKGIVLTKGSLTVAGTAYEAIEHYILSTDKKMIYLDNGYVDLSSTRETEHHAKIFKGIRMLDKNNNLCETFSVLSPMRVEVELGDNDLYPDADYGISISTPAGQRVTSFATWMYPKKRKQTPCKLSLDIPQIKYSPGSYRISLSATFHSSGEWLDRVENAVIFHVEAADIFKSGKIFTSDYGVLLPEGELDIC